MKIAVITITDSGKKTAELLVRELPGARHFHSREPGGLPTLTAELFRRYEGLVFIMATGIVVRMIAPLLTDKYHDPAVVVVDDGCRYAISLLSGHEGGANRLAWKTAAIVGAEPVVTTATETNKRVIIGIGCRRGVTAEEITEGVRSACKDAGTDIDQVRCAATIDLKKDEAGLIEGLDQLDIPLRFFTAEQINKLSYGPEGAFEENEVTMRCLGVRAVSEPCALLAAGRAEIILPKSVYGEVTVAVAREKDVRVVASEATCGKLAIIGIGPGNEDEISPRAVQALRDADLVVGYTRYIGFIENLIPGKEVYTSGMRREKERAEHAVEAAGQGKTVAVVSGGDAGVYGLAGLVLELLEEEDVERIGIEVIPGITAATAAAAVLGAPLMHDFAVISLSDLLTEPDRIRERLRAAAIADFVTVIYNPKSKKREKLFQELPDIFLPHRRSDTPVGIVTDAGRNGEERLITTLAELTGAADRVRMGTTLIIGNSRSMVKGGFIITPRGYKL